MNTATTFAALLVVAVVYALDRFNLLPKRKGAADLAAEALLTERALARANTELVELRRTRTLEPILEQLAATATASAKAQEPVLEQLRQNAELQAQVLDRLVHHNGSFRHMEKSLGEIHESLKTLTGFIVGLHGIEPHH